jgi:hypothetical protein
VVAFLPPFSVVLSLISVINRVLLLKVEKKKNKGAEV